MDEKEPVVDIVIPVFNEEKILLKSVKKLTYFLKHSFGYTYVITIVDNASTDKTMQVAEKIRKDYSNIRLIHLDLKGKGRAIKKAWETSKAKVVSFMDADLSTDLEAFPSLIKSVVEGGDISIGARMVEEAKVKRSLRREILSRGYNFLLKVFFLTKVSDAQCGFKAMNKNKFIRLLPELENDGWFFDTELLIKAEKKGLRIKEIPVTWVEGKKSAINTFGAVFDFVKAIIKLRLEL